MFDDDAINEKIGEIIKKKRCEINFTQGEMADKCGLSRVYISNIEAGKHSLSIHNLKRILTVLNLKVADLKIKGLK